MFETDYIVSWDFSDPDFLKVDVSRLRASEKGAMLECDVIGAFRGEKCGIVSLRQLLDRFDAERKENNK